MPMELSARGAIDHRPTSTEAPCANISPQTLSKSARATSPGGHVRSGPHVGAPHGPGPRWPCVTTRKVTHSTALSAAAATTAAWLDPCRTTGSDRQATPPGATTRPRWAAPGPEGKVRAGQCAQGAQAPHWSSTRHNTRVDAPKEGAQTNRRPRYAQTRPKA